MTASHIDRSFCDLQFHGFATTCNRCGCWARGTTQPECPPYITCHEPDNRRLPNIKTDDENSTAYVTWYAEEIEQHPLYKRGLVLLNKTAPNQLLKQTKSMGQNS